MKIITDVKFIETPESKTTVLRNIFSDNTPYMRVGKDVVRRDYIEEKIHGRRIVNKSLGIDIVLGVSREAADIIYSGYQAYNNCFIENGKLRKEVDDIRRIINAQNNKINKIKNMSFWNRLKFLFKLTDEV